MTKFKVYLKNRRWWNKQTPHVVYGKNYAVSTNSPGIKRLVIYNDENRHVFTVNWNLVECMYMDEICQTL
jgi:hypothetical protein